MKPKPQQHHTGAGLGITASDHPQTSTLSPVQDRIEGKHLGYLDSCRAIAAVTVMICHASGQCAWPSYPRDSFFWALLRSASYLGDLGHYCVDFFIVLSGFCLMLQVIRHGGLLRGGALAFFVRRGWRIVPPYYCSLLLSLLLIWLFIGHKTGTHWDVSLPVTWRSIVTHFLLVQDFYGESTTINHALWSISVEWRIYFLFPLLLVVWKRGGMVATTLATLIASLLIVSTSTILGSALSTQYFGLFALGMFGATVAFSSSHPIAARLPWGYITLALVPIIFSLSNADRFHRPIPLYVDDYFVGCGSIALLLLVSLQRQCRLRRLLDLRPLTFIGAFAYSIYLIHAPLLQMLSQYLFFPLQNSPWLMFGALVSLGIPGIIAVSYAFFLLCERPFVGARNWHNFSATPPASAPKVPAR